MADLPGVDPVEQARAWLLHRTGVCPGPTPGDTRSDGFEGADSRPGSEEAAGTPCGGDEIHPAGRGGDEIAQAGRGRAEAPRTRAGDDEIARARRGGDETTDPDADPESVARTILIRMLAAQDRSRYELATALRVRNVPEPIAEELLDRFAELGLIDDRAFAARWVESRHSRRHRSRLALRRELQAKGIDKEIVDAALATIEPDAEQAAADAYARKAAHSLAHVDPAVRRRRIADRLARRGYPTGVIARAMNELESSANENRGP